LKKRLRIYKNSPIRMPHRLPGYRDRCWRLDLEMA
jgi:hypothetical protein